MVFRMKMPTFAALVIWAIGEKAPMDSNTIARLMIASLKDPHNASKWHNYLGIYGNAEQVKAMNLQNRAAAARYLAEKTLRWRYQHSFHCWMMKIKMLRHSERSTRIEQLWRDWQKLWFQNF